LSQGDWERYLAEFKEASVRRGKRDRERAAARSWVRFLKATGSLPNVASLLEWTIRNAQSFRIEVVVGRLHWIEPFLSLLSQHGVISPDAARTVRERPHLLSYLQSLGPLRFRTPVEPYWESYLTGMVGRLQGLDIRYQVQMLEAARLFAARLPAGPLEPTAWKLCLWEWVDELLRRHALEYVRSKLMPGLDRFLHELVLRGECEGHLLRQWRETQTGWVEALRRRKQGAPPQFRLPPFGSFLAPHFEAFISFRRSLGRKFKCLSTLRTLDRYLITQQVPNLGSISAAFLAEFLAGRNWKSSTRRTATGELRRFFNFLVRREVLSSHQNPARHLARTRSSFRCPYIFLVREIAAFLAELLRDPLHHPFDQTMQFTFFHLVYACALRISEPLRLKVGDVELEEQTLFIRGTKFGKDRKIPLGPRAAEYLKRYHQMRCQRLGEPEATAPFFVRAVGRGAHQNTLRTSFREACRRAGVGSPNRPQPRPHDLRHSMAVHRLYKWYLEGADPQKRLILLSIYMGHVAPRSTQYYLNLSHDLLRIAGRPLEKALEDWLKESLPPDER
jgi:site-specific recombinase XerD